MTGERLVALQQYMDKLVTKPGVARSYEMLRFLSESDLPQAEQASASSATGAAAAPTGTGAGTRDEGKEADDGVEDEAEEEA